MRDLRVTFHDGDVTAVNRFDLDLAPGERVAVVGESGSGKSTSCSAIAGFVTDPGSSVDASVLRFDDADLTRRRRTRMPRRIPEMSMMFQDAMTSLDAVWTVGSQLCDALAADPEVPRRERRARAAGWLERVGIPDAERVLRARPYELSGGMRQRVMLAIALCSRPKLLIADEPTSALDATLSVEMMRLMVELTETAGAALLIVSHDIRLCEAFADRLVVMYRGEVVETIAARNLPLAQHPYTRALADCVPTLGNYDADWLPTIDGPRPVAEPVHAKVA
ncbi:ATP-binding cassette domain-containing protein [Microbacterium excoecariae]|uniref:ATP-binding cassette domain-containing protein n=1 Tax=Microbacterium excoecariae TaxID=2715210 RepID=UPI00197B1E21